MLKNTIVPAGIAVVISLVFGLAFYAPSQQPVGQGTVITAPDIYSNGVTIGTQTFQTYSAQVPLGTTSQLVFHNKLGRDFIVDKGEVTTLGTSTAAVRIGIGTTTLSFINPYLDPSASGLVSTSSIFMNGYATTSIASTTDSFFDIRLPKKSPIVVKDGEKVMCYVLQGLSGTPSICDAAGACVATSSSLWSNQKGPKCRIFGHYEQ